MNFGRRLASRMSGPPVYQAGLGAFDIIGGQGFGFGSRDDPEFSQQSAVRNPWLSKGLSMVIELMATSEAFMVDDKGVKVVNQEIADQLNMPNPWMGQQYLWESLVWDMYLEGESFLYFEPHHVDTDRWEVTDLWPLPARQIVPQVKNGQIEGYLWERENEKPIPIFPEYVVYSRFRDPLDDGHCRGLSPLIAAGLAIRQDRNMNRWNDTYFGPRNAIPSMIFNFKNPEKKDGDHSQIRANLLKDLSGPVQQPLITRADEIEIKTLQSSARDMEFDKGLERTKRVVEHVLGYPEGYMSAKANRANAEAARATLIEATVWPLLKRFRNNINAHFDYWENCISRKPGELVEFEDIRPRDRRLAVIEIKSKRDYLSVNEIREEQGHEPFEDEKYNDRPAVDSKGGGPGMPGGPPPPVSGGDPTPGDGSGEEGDGDGEGGE